MLRVALAFIHRDFLQAISYRAAFVLRLVTILFGASVLYFVSSVFEGSASPFLQPYGGTYFPFVLIGMALVDYHTLSLQVFSSSIRESQMMGTLEIMLLSPTRLTTMILFSSLWGYIFTSLRFVIYLLVGIFLFGLPLGRANLAGAGVTLIVSIISFAGIGIVTASIIVLIKEAGSLDLFLGSVSLLLGGVIFPVEVMPGWLQQLASLLPVTHSLTAMRQALLQGYPLVRLAPELTVLLGFAVLLWPAGLFAFHWAVQRVKVSGTLGHY